MLRIEVDAAGLGWVRFAVSPLAVAVDALMLGGTGPISRQRIGVRVRDVLRERRLVLL